MSIKEVVDILDKKSRGRTIRYWKNNAEEDYLGTPISVLKYIAILEEELQIDPMLGQ